MEMTMIIGIGTEMAILYVSEYAELTPAMGTPPRTARGEPQPIAPDNYDYPGCNSHADAAGSSDRPGLSHSAAARDLYHRRFATAVPPRAACHAGPHRIHLTGYLGDR